MTLSATLALMTDAGRERVRLRLGTAFIEHAADLWPKARRRPGRAGRNDNAARISSPRHCLTEGPDERVDPERTLSTAVVAISRSAFWAVSRKPLA
jgi:hypothetical protein